VLSVPGSGGVADQGLPVQERDADRLAVFGRAEGRLAGVIEVRAGPFDRRVTADVYAAHIRSFMQISYSLRGESLAQTPIFRFSSCKTRCVVDAVDWFEDG
jgi:hypothetical protein